MEKEQNPNPNLDLIPWERVCDDHFDNVTERLPVPGGWLYRNRGKRDMTNVVSHGFVANTVK